MSATDELILELQAGRPVALATVIGRRGSAPGALGAKMMVREDGTNVGSIGGGCVEAEVWQAARDAMGGEGARVLSFRLNARDMAESGLICGGTVDILVEPLDSTHAAVLRAARELQASRRLGVLVTVLPGEDAPGPTLKFLLTQEGALGAEGLLPELVHAARTEAALAAGEVRTVDVPLAGGRTRLILESVAPQATLVLFGAGHLSKGLAPLAKQVGFRVVVIDDRAFFADPALFPDADEVIAAEFEQVFQRLAVDRDSFLVIVTRGHLHDSTVLEQALSTEAAYVGMIGSKTKIRTIYRDLQARGVAAERLAWVHAPIGLPIGARSPEEIAVSILAELISVRNGGQATRAAAPAASL